MMVTAIYMFVSAFCCVAFSCSFVFCFVVRTHLPVESLQQHTVRSPLLHRVSWRSRHLSRRTFVVPLPLLSPHGRRSQPVDDRRRDVRRQVRRRSGHLFPWRRRGRLGSRAYDEPRTRRTRTATRHTNFMRMRRRRSTLHTTHIISKSAAGRRHRNKTAVTR